MPRTSRTQATNGSRSGSEEPEVRPFVRRPDDDILAALEGRQVLNAASLARNSTPVANYCRKLDAVEKVRKVELAARSLGFELPSKAKDGLHESTKEDQAMNRFLKSTEGDVGGPVEDESWNALIAVDPLAADIEAEVQRTRKVSKGRAGKHK